MPFSLAGAPARVSGFVLSDQFDQVSATVRAGFDTLTVQGVSIGLGYEGQYGENVEQHSGNLKVGIDF